MGRRREEGVQRIKHRNHREELLCLTLAPRDSGLWPCSYPKASARTSGLPKPWVEKGIHPIWPRQGTAAGRVQGEERMTCTTANTFLAGPSKLHLGSSGPLFLFSGFLGALTAMSTCNKACGCIITDPRQFTFRLLHVVWPSTEARGGDGGCPPCLPVTLPIACNQATAGH